MTGRQARRRCSRSGARVEHEAFGGPQTGPATYTAPTAHSAPADARARRARTRTRYAAHRSQP